jgi:hypothetical protein
MSPRQDLRADRHRALPETTAARHDEIQAALRSLREEGRRLERLGLELPLARCHEETRYWSFLAGIFSLPSDARSSRMGFPCPDDRA